MALISIVPVVKQMALELYEWRILLDRFVCVYIAGYTQEEKVEIAHRHLIPHQLEQHGLTPQQLQIPQDTTQEIISK